MLTLKKSKTDERLFVAAIATPPISNTPTTKCVPSQNTHYVLMQPHLNWIRNQTGSQLCPSEDKQKPSKIGQLFVLTLSSLVLSILLVVLALILLMLFRKRKELASKFFRSKM